MGKLAIPGADTGPVASQRELPGFTQVLLADGFHQATDGAWLYDPFTSWMRFPLNR